MTTYSHSRLSTFEQCQYKYKLQYIDKVKTAVETTIEAFMGSLVHKTLEKLYKDLKFQKLNSVKDLLVFYNDLWKKEWSKDVLVVKKEYGPENYRKLGEKFISDYYEQYKPFDKMVILGLETQDRMELPDGNHYHVRIDKLACVGSTYFVCDYKTNNRLKDQEEADEDRQLAMYSIFVKNKFRDAKKIVLLWHMLAFNKEVVSERSDKQLQKLQDETVELIKAIEKATKFPTHVTNLCSYCPYKAICPAFKHELKIEKLSVDKFKKDDGVKLVDEYAELEIKRKATEERLEEVKQKLISFGQQEEVTTVYGSNKKASIKEYESLVLPEDPKDKAKFVELLKKTGQWDEFSMINYSRLNARAEELDKALLKMTTTRKGYTIRIGKKEMTES